MEAAVSLPWHLLSAESQECWPRGLDRCRRSWENSDRSRQPCWSTTGTTADDRTCKHSQTGCRRTTTSSGDSGTRDTSSDWKPSASTTSRFASRSTSRHGVGRSSYNVSGPCSGDKQRDSASHPNGYCAAGPACSDTNYGSTNRSCSHSSRGHGINTDKHSGSRDCDSADHAHSVACGHCIQDDDHNSWSEANHHNYASRRHDHHRCSSQQDDRFTTCSDGTTDDCRTSGDHPDSNDGSESSRSGCPKTADRSDSQASGDDGDHGRCQGCSRGASGDSRKTGWSRHKHGHDHNRQVDDECHHSVEPSGWSTGCSGGQAHRGS